MVLHRIILYYYIIFLRIIFLESRGKKDRDVHGALVLPYKFTQDASTRGMPGYAHGNKSGGY